MVAMLLMISSGVNAKPATSRPRFGRSRCLRMRANSQTPTKEAMAVAMLVAHQPPGMK
jgi:hypothetical protein